MGGGIKLPRNTATTSQDAAAINEPSANITNIKAVQRTKPPEVYLMGVLKRTTKSSRIVGVTASMCEGYKALAEQIRLAIISEHLTKQQAVALRDKLIQ